LQQTKVCIIKCRTCKEDILPRKNLIILPVVKTKASDEDGRRTVQSQVDMACGRSYTHKFHTYNPTFHARLCRGSLYSTLNRRNYCLSEKIECTGTGTMVLHQKCQVADIFFNKKHKRLPFPPEKFNYNTGIADRHNLYFKLISLASVSYYCINLAGKESSVVDPSSCCVHTW
jgi:hypothetical protein